MTMLTKTCPRNHLVAQNALLVLTKTHRCSYHQLSTLPQSHRSVLTLKNIITKSRRSMIRQVTTHTSSNALAQKLRVERTAQLTYPERLLIYHSGTMRTALIGMFRVAGILAFTFFSIGIAPAAYANPEYPKWFAPFMTVLGAIPAFSNVWLTSSFVNSIYIRLPIVARQSKGALVRFMSNIPSNTRLDIVTLRFIGLPKTNTIMIGELRSKRSASSLDISNMVRIPSALRNDKTTRNWWRTLAEFFEPRNRFYVGNKHSGIGTKAPFAWGKILDHINEKGRIK